MKVNKLLSSMLAVLAVAPAAVADEASTTPENYMRSSIYTVLIKSAEQNRLLDEESKQESTGAALIKGFANTDAKRAANDTTGVSVSEAPQVAFLTIPVPDQFNDMNLGLRVLPFDEIAANLTEAEIAQGKELFGEKKKGGFGKMLGSVAAGAAGIPLPVNPANQKIDELGATAVYKFITSNNVADSLVANWFNYGKSESVWDIDNIIERGMYNASEQEKETARKQGMESGLGQKHGLNLIPNTYVIAINLRFRSNQAIVAEAEAIANAVASQAGGLGSLASLASAGASAAAGEGFQVQAHTYLFKLVWNEDLNNKMAEEFVFAQNKPSLDDLIKAGFCKMEYVGKEKASARVRQSILNTTPQSVLTERATVRAIDAAIAKLQEKFDVFRTSFPISKVDEQGNVYARVGMKEGIEKDDEYEILEMQEDKNGKTIWKSVGKVKAVDKQIWDNRAGAAEDLAEELAEAQAKNKEVKGDNYASLGYTTFKGAKKGQDYSGYFLRLKKKK